MSDAGADWRRDEVVGVGGAPSEPSVPSDADTWLLARRGVGGYRQYRIPAMAVTTSGRILVAYDARPDIDDLPSPIDIVMRTSDDNGRTWSRQRVIRTGSGFSGYGDPSLLVDAHTRRIFLMHAATQLAGFFESSAGIDDDDPHVEHADLGYSDDDGETWTFRRITGQLKRPPIEGLFAASGQGAQIVAGRYAGRLLQPYVVRQGDLISAAVAYSDDHGENWTLGELVGRGTNESKVVPLDDGSVVLNSRGTPCRMVAVSHDGGASFTGLRADPGLPDPSDNGSAIRLDGRPVLRSASDQANVVLCAHNHDPDLRRNLVIKYSPDAGASWTRRCVVYPGSAGYSVLSRLPDGDLGVLYEREGYTQLAFQRIGLDEFTAETDGPTTADSAADPLQFEMVLRFVRPARPAVFADPGASHAIALDEGPAFSPAEWREIGQANTADTTQTLYTREALERNLGRPDPGLSVGDELRFTGRISNAGAVPARHVVLSGSFDESDGTQVGDLDVGERCVFRAVRRYVTAADLTRGTVEVNFRINATVGDARLTRSITRCYRMATGLPVASPPPRSSCFGQRPHEP